MDNPGLKELTAALKARLFYAETNGGDYNAQNKHTKALGKYQFHPKYWWKSIKSFAKKSGYGDINEEDFKANGDLQEEFFDQEYMPKVYNFVKAQVPNNKRNLDLDEIAQLYHLHPGQTKEYIKGGGFDAGKHNMKAEQYLKKGLQGMNQFGAKQVSEGSFLNKSEKEKSVNNYLSKINEINNSQDTEGAKKMKIMQLKQEHYDKGLMNFINTEISRKSNDFEAEKRFFSEIYGQSQKNIQRKASSGRPYYHLKIDTEKGKNLIDQLIEKNPKIAKDIHKVSNGKYTATLGLGKTALNQYLLNGAKKFAGYEAENFQQLILDKKFEGGMGNPLVPNFSIDSKNDELLSLDFNKNAFDPGKFSISNTEISPRQKDYSTKPQTEKEIAKSNAPAKQENSSSINLSNVEEAKKSDESALDNFLKNETYLDEPDNLEYNKENFSADIPFGAVADAMLGAVGMEQANTDVPLRTEQVSEGVMDYARKMAQLSQMGLPPEIEAKLKNDNAEAYSGMLNNIVEASAGNRNLVLGNQGQLDYNRMLANNDVAIADYEQKQIALEKYGEVMSYINEFNARRDIDNTRTKQEVAFKRREDGQDLAFAGFSSMAESLAFASENAPGTANHMLMSQIRQKAFGFDPDMKDDGKGNTKGTRSWYMKNVVDPIKANNANIDFIKENSPGLNEGQNNFINLVASKTGKTDDIVKAINFAKSNDISKVNETNISSALDSGNFQQMLFKDFDSEDFVTDKVKQDYEYKNIV